MKSKRIFSIFLLLVLSAIGVSGQTTEPVFPNDYPSKESLRWLLINRSFKGAAYYHCFVNAVKKNLSVVDTTYLSLTNIDVDAILEKISLEKVNLQKGKYFTYAYNFDIFHMVPEGEKFGWVAVWVFKIKNFSIPLIEGETGNIIEAH